MPHVVVIAHNIRSVYNVGSLFRTAEGFGVEHIIVSGYTPYPATADDHERPPHVALKLDKQIHKTALGAEQLIPWRHVQDPIHSLEDYKKQGYILAALEQSATSQSLSSYQVPDKLVLVLGNEVDGVEPQILKLCDVILEIPMAGHKESFNVVIAAAVALYHLTLPKQTYPISG